MSRCASLVLTAILFWPSAAGAQSGPLTENLPVEEPKTFSFRLGPVLMSPNLTMRDLGVDTNVFNEPENPQTDWTVALVPDLRFFTRTGLLQFSGIAGADFTYFHEFESERSISRQFRGRLDLYMSRFRPWFGAALIDMRDRPNREIDLRTRRTDAELTAGLSFTLSPIASVYGMATRVDQDLANLQIYEGVNLDTSLSRREDSYSIGVKIQATPFTTVTVSGNVEENRFATALTRNAETRSAMVRFEFAPEAVIRGRVSLGYSDFNPNDANLEPYHGLVSAGTIAYTLLGRATVETSVIRDVTYSYDPDDAYYVETGVDLVYTHLLAGPYDMRLRGSRRWLDYTRTVPGFRPAVDAFAVGLGYNFQDRSRLGLEYEYSQRIDDERPDRRFHNRRFFGSYTMSLAR